MLFLVVPSLSVGLIVGCSAFIELDFKELRLIINGNERCSVPFLNRGRDDESGVDNEVDPLADDSFFVELVYVRGVEVARLRANQIERE